MALNIVIPGQFSTPGLPKLGARGFVDTFTRADSTVLGRTERPRRVWTFDSSTTECGIVDGQGYVRSTSTAGPRTALAESGISDGSVEMVISSISSGSISQFGLAFRGTSLTHYFRFHAHSTDEYRLALVTGGATEVGTYSKTPEVGDRLRVDMSGESIRCYVNGTLAITHTESTNVNATMHGIYCNWTTPQNRASEITVTP